MTTPERAMQWCVFKLMDFGMWFWDIGRDWHERHNTPWYRSTEPSDEAVGRVLARIQREKQRQHYTVN